MKFLLRREYTVEWVDMSDNILPDMSHDVDKVRPHEHIPRVGDHVDIGNQDNKVATYIVRKVTWMPRVGRILISLEWDRWEK